MLHIIVDPIDSAELAPAEIRGSLVALQQLAIVFGIMVSCKPSFPTSTIN
jgi:hypothetical protein